MIISLIAFNIPGRKKNFPGEDLHNSRGTDRHLEETARGFAGADRPGEPGAGIDK